MIKKTLLLLAIFLITFSSGWYGGVRSGESIFSFMNHTQADEIYRDKNKKDQDTEKQELIKKIQSDVDLSEFWEVWSWLDKKFIFASATNTLTTEDKVRGAIKGLVEAYDDPYTVYFEPKEFKDFNTDISGNFGGVGMEVGMREGLITVISPLSDTPAEKAGVLPGDFIIKINDESTENMMLHEAVDLIRGEIGTEVKLQLFRQSQSKFIDVTIVRDNIDIPTIKTEQVDDVFIISLYSFNAIANSKMYSALNDYVKSGANKLILDLRGNPGGFLTGAVKVGGYFLPPGKVVVKESFGDGREDRIFRTTGTPLVDLNKDNFAVLVNGGSASASEILAGALHDHGRATLIGEKTYGKGSVQELIPLSEKSALKVTIARWLTPKGNSISGQGLTPDIIITRSVEDILGNKDPQRKAAIKFLSGEEVLGEKKESQLSKKIKDSSTGD